MVEKKRGHFSHLGAGSASRSTVVKIMVSGAAHRPQRSDASMVAARRGSSACSSRPASTKNFAALLTSDSLFHLPACSCVRCALVEICGQKRGATQANAECGLSAQCTRESGMVIDGAVGLCGALKGLESAFIVGISFEESSLVEVATPRPSCSCFWARAIAWMT